MGTQLQLEISCDNAASATDLKDSTTENGRQRASDGSRLFRPIHYLGSKLRLADRICQEIDRVASPGGRVCDLFAGSGTVSACLAYSRPVTAVDIQEYSRILCAAVLKPERLSIGERQVFIYNARESQLARDLSWASAPLIAYELDCRDRARHGHVEPLCEVLENGSLATYEDPMSEPRSPNFNVACGEASARLATVRLLEGRDSLTTRYYGGVYFSYQQAAALDAISAAILDQDEALHDTMLAALLSTASDIVNTVGKHFAQPLRPRHADGTPKRSISAQVERDRNIDPWQTYRSWLDRYMDRKVPNIGHEVQRSDYLEVLRRSGSDISVVYADPPYTRDHYSRFYHVLETLAHRDIPDISTTRRNGSLRMSRGIYPTNRYQSPFCIRSQAPVAFEALFEITSSMGIPLVLSYSPHESDDGTHPRVVPLSALVSLAERVFQKVTVKDIGDISHSHLNNVKRRLKGRENAEVLLVCQPR